MNHEYREDRFALKYPVKTVGRFQAPAGIRVKLRSMVRSAESAAQQSLGRKPWDWSLYILRVFVPLGTA
jgi:hypothetical protein